ncbi:Beta sliding clamp [subsurface metagenome]
MKIVSLQENLKKGLNIIQNIIGKNLTLPILNNILLAVEKKRLRLVSTDLEIAITHWTSCKVKKEGDITVPAKLFGDLINNLPNKKVEIEVKENLLQIKCENFESVIKGMDCKEFPIIPKIKGDLIMKIGALKLKQAFSQVVNFTSLSDIRPEISGVYLDINSKGMKFVATDSFRLGEKTLSIKNNKNKIKKSVIIPLRTVQELIRILAEQDKEEMIEIVVEQNQILFKTPDTQIISRLIEGTYPNYEQLISKQFETSLILDRNEFLNTVKVTSLFSSRINDLRLKVVPKKFLVEVFAQDAEIGENISQLKGEMKGKALEIIFNHKYLLDGLNNIDSSKVMLGLNGGASPGILKPVGDPSYIYVIMPIKL